MPASLQDQLKKSGLIDDKKAKQLKRAKHKQEKLARKTKNPAADQHKLELDRAKSEKIAKDRQLNMEKNKQAEKHALAAQIKQLIEMNIVANDGDQKFSFTDANIIRHIYVNQTQIDQLSRGKLAIVTQKDGQKHNHVLVPMGVANKIEQRDAKVVVFTAPQNTVGEEEDPYADFQIPDDLTW
ncbi:MAG: nucleoprotein/polynucleotide-associated enzyme [SAR86 cluster bacterium]|uniref:Nucleoprotein/polynucleotide-associated enzyme n=1 Tax=SAR86 cluster bacterium TaxID=2030880 RepID=A0A2A4X9A9_9GAMM|nr:MAG: nucleoprotein/polynucleotide-associated enzyme [SAR86 cluster bacterium]